VAQRVLVVDDDRTVSDVVCRYLEHAGYEVSHAAASAAAPRAGHNT
jgi:DNA-binding response OmpR family regulator